MKHRKLRIAWSVTWGIAAILLVVVWVRSYWRDDIFTPPGSLTSISFGSGAFTVEPLREEPLDDSWHWETAKIISDSGLGYKPMAVLRLNPFVLVISPSGLLALLPIAAAVLPWLRFSLRTLLIAITVVAVGLALIMWLR